MGALTKHASWAGGWCGVSRGSNGGETEEIEEEEEGKEPWVCMGVTAIEVRNGGKALKSPVLRGQRTG